MGRLTVLAVAAVPGLAGPGATMADGKGRSEAAATGREGRLRALPRPAAGESATAAEAGTRPLGLGPEGGRDGVLHLPPLPPGGDPGQAAPLLLALHGAGGSAAQLLPLLAPLADAHGFVLVAPDSRRVTWDVILDDYGPDVAFIDRALQDVCARHPVDPARVAVCGFSDGASYALSLGLTNGDLFGHVLAFSPGFMAPAGTPGSPPVFVTHGVADEVLPIGRTSRRLVPALERAGYTVAYREFAGGHLVPPELAAEAVDWFAGG